MILKKPSLKPVFFTPWALGIFFSRNPFPLKFFQMADLASGIRFSPSKRRDVLELGYGAFFNNIGSSGQEISSYVGVSKNRGTPKWMIYNGKPY